MCAGGVHVIFCADSDAVHALCRELLRYRQFLGIQKEQQNIAEEQAKLKSNFRAGVDFTSPDNLKTIEQAKQEGLPADRWRFRLHHTTYKRNIA